MLQIKSSTLWTSLRGSSKLLHGQKCSFFFVFYQSHIYVNIFVRPPNAEQKGQVPHSLVQLCLGSIWHGIFWVAFFGLHNYVIRHSSDCVKHPPKSKQNLIINCCERNLIRKKSINGSGTLYCHFGLSSFSARSHLHTRFIVTGSRQDRG